MRSRSCPFLCLLISFFPAFAVAQASQTVTFTPVATVAIGVSPITLTATASSGLTATQPGDANFASAAGNANIDIVASLASVAWVAVQSRKTHASAGSFDISISPNPPGGVTVEPRAIGAAHNIVFQFSGPVTSVSGATAIGVQGTAYATTSSFTGSEVTVAVSNAPDNMSVTVSLTGVNGTQNFSAPVGFLIGDANTTGSVNSSDISGTKARSGQPTTASNFKPPSIDVAVPPAGVAGDAYSFTFIATGTVPINWTVIAGSVPAGLNLHPTRGELLGTTAATGTFNFTVQAANGVLPNATRAVSLVINAATVITSAAPLPATASLAYSHTFTATGVQPMTWTASGPLPGWATLNANTGVLSGTPPSPGSSSFTVTASNAVTTKSVGVTLVVNTPDRPLITSGIPLAIGTIGQAYSHTFTATGSTPIVWTIASGSLPGGLSLSSTGVISGVPSVAGLHKFTVQAANGVGANALSPEYAISITAADVSTDGLTLANVSKFAFVIPMPRDPPFLNGAGNEVNAYSISPTRCSTTPPLTRSWQHNIDLADYKGKNAFDFFVMQANEALTYKFAIGNVDVSGGFIYNDSATAVVRPTFMSVTTTPCDFDTTKLVVGPNRDACYQTGLNGNSINWANVTTPLPEAYCRLVKGQTYYLNIRFQDGRPAIQGGSPTSDSCTSGNCGGIIQVL
ncbi:MAG: putative Ig domain-containing protein [Usitatibacteraceae bacterium]